MGASEQSGQEGDMRLADVLDVVADDGSTQDGVAHVLDKLGTGEHPKPCRIAWCISQWRLCTLGVRRVIAPG